MPHTNKKKRSWRTKRVEVEDEDGWTRVTKSTNCPAMAKIEHSSQLLSEPMTEYDSADLKTEPSEHVIPEDASVEKATARYGILHERWLSSESWAVLRSSLIDNILPAAPTISTCVVFGTGTATGCFRGWITRHDVSLTQIAVFKSVVDIITSIQGKAPLCYAQEPEYNHLDIAFLASLNITTVNHPEGFALLDKSSFAYTPGAEFIVAIRTAFREPHLYLSHTINHYTRDEKGLPATPYRFYYSASQPGKGLTLHEYEAEEGNTYEIKTLREEHENECRVVERFTSDHEYIKIPDLDAENHPFFDQSIYYRSTASTDRPAQPTP